MKLELAIMLATAALVAVVAAVGRTAKGNARMYETNWQAGRYGDELADWHEEEKQ